MIPSLSYDLSGKLESPLSGYNPSPEVKKLTGLAWQDLIQGDEILNRPFNEFNDMSLIQRMNLDQKDWLGWSPAPSEDPDEKWMFTGTSAATRNKIISTAAHLTQQVIFPNIFAQNEDDENDEEAAYIMRTAIEYNCRKNNYEQSFLYAVISGLVNPVSYFKIDYCQTYQEILEGNASEYKKVKVLDDIMSGFQYSLIPPEEILIANPYCFDIQKQPFVIHRRRISYHDAESYYSDRDEFKHVKPGIVSIFNADDALFYEAHDAYEDGLVEEITLKYRKQDREVCFVNGIYLSNPNTAFNPIKHRTNKNKPKYNIVKFGAEPIDAQRFWAYKSLASKLSNDKELVDRMRQNAVDASTFATFPSLFGIGTGKINKSVFIPATITHVDKDAKIEPATGFANPQYAYQAAAEAERAMTETSQDPQLSGIGGGDKTARESILIQQNALTNLGIMGKMIGFMVKDSGELMVDDILRYQTVGEVQEMSGGLAMQYKTLILNDKVRDGKKTSVVIKFTDEYAGRKMTQKEIDEENIKLYMDDEDIELYKVNPVLWRKKDFLIVVEPDALKPKNDAFEKTLKLELYDRAINNPLIAQDPDKMAEITRDFLFLPTVGGDAAKYIPKDTMNALAGLVPQPQKGLSRRVVESKAMNNLLPV